MGIALATLVVLVALAVSLWLAYSALRQVRQLRRELDQTQGLLNEARTQLGSLRPPPSSAEGLSEVRQELGGVRRDLDELRQEVSELHAAAEVLPPPPPPLPKSRSSGLEDLRAQLRAAHREEEAAGETEPPAQG